MTGTENTIGDGDGQRTPATHCLLESVPTRASRVGKDEPSRMECDRTFCYHRHPQERIGINGEACLSVVRAIRRRRSDDECHIVGTLGQLYKGITAPFSNAAIPNPAPNAIDPVSPMKTLAG